MSPYNGKNTGREEGTEGLSESVASIRKVQDLLRSTNGGSLLLRNLGTHLAHYRVLQHRVSQSEKPTLKIHRCGKKKCISEFLILSVKYQMCPLNNKTNFRKISHRPITYIIVSKCYLLQRDLHLKLLTAHTNFPALEASFEVILLKFFK